MDSFITKLDDILDNARYRVENHDVLKRELLDVINEAITKAEQFYDYTDGVEVAHDMAAEIRKKLGLTQTKENQ